jgi:hypothetical protein
MTQNGLLGDSSLRKGSLIELFTDMMDPGPLRDNNQSSKSIGDADDGTEPVVSDNDQSTQDYDYSGHDNDWPERKSSSSLSNAPIYDLNGKIIGQTGAQVDNNEEEELAVPMLAQKQLLVSIVAEEQLVAAETDKVKRYNGISSSSSSSSSSSWYTPGNEVNSSFFVFLKTI